MIAHGIRFLLPNLKLSFEESEQIFVRHDWNHWKAKLGPAVEQFCLCAKETFGALRQLTECSDWR
jgi:hypothetical protein